MKKIVEKIKELNKTSKGKAILFFAFYLCFFLIVILISRFSTRTPFSRTEDYEPGNENVTFHIDDILKSNYIYSYAVTLDGVKSEYYGQKYDDTEMFEFNGRQYYRNGNDFYVRNTLWTKAVNPYLFPEFFDINNISKLMDVATYQSKTSYEDGKKAYNFLLSSNSINQLLKNINSDFLEEPNTVTLEIDDERNVNKIEFNLGSYCTLNKLCKSSLKIEIEYDMFGEVTKIDNPVG